MQPADIEFIFIELYTRNKVPIVTCTNLSVDLTGYKTVPVLLSHF